ncbi:hypothetical protein HDV00_011024 [Rhizophlyctis rosea]|nr:hypothetical protein HDV00_011024 [Rhizophlyctis rosea]
MPGGYTRVYVGKLARDTSERDVKKLAKEFGPIRDIRLLSGFAFVEFEDDRDAKDCVKTLDGEKFRGERLMVEPARLRGRHHERTPSPRRGDRYFPEGRHRSRTPPTRRPGGGLARTPYRVSVFGLPSRTSWQSLKDLMRKAGEVTYADVDRNGDGLVEFASEADADAAVKMMDGTDYEGNTLTVKKASVRGDDDSEDDRRGGRRGSDDRGGRRRRDDSRDGRRGRDDSRDRDDRKDVKREKEEEEDDRDYRSGRRESNASRGSYRSERSDDRRGNKRDRDDEDEREDDREAKRGRGRSVDGDRDD